MRERGEDLLLAVVDDVDMAAPSRKGDLVQAAFDLLDDDRHEGLAVVRGAGHHDARFVAFHVGGVHRQPIGGIDHDLRVVLSLL